MRNLFPVIADKKAFFFVSAILSKKVLIACTLPLALLSGYAFLPQVSMTQAHHATYNKNPNHIAIIMDGNGRWGKKVMGDRSHGHKHAKQAVKEAITGCLEQGIPYLTLYAFSTENWSRPEQEVNTIFRTLAEGIDEDINLFTKHNIKFRVVGDTKEIPSFCWDSLKKAIEFTKHNTQLHLTVAINYGGQAEAVAASEAIANDFLIKAVHAFLNKGFNSNARFEDFIKFAHNYRAKITPTLYKEYLNTSHLPDIDLLIRTGGKKRISNFLPWHSAYSELYFTDLYWPVFTKEDLMEALAFFQKQQRNFGGVT